ncbi:M20 family metallopeptidase [Occultella aeris]|uniref:Peptidase M20 domain-containing protein 2 n=1 Tax=Occultella aeris TaxID=2761496 RepID=A0A7M4DF15_9MICO|nr:M20 family metallopeptidase [Occultella aeris]VZO35508.1 p-aminobenzoyl-glutamate hydrolase subunit B [Occultella aeris]
MSAVTAPSQVPSANRVPPVNKVPPPSRAYLDALAETTRRRTEAFVPLASPYQGAPRSAVESVRASLTQRSGAVLDLAHAVFGFAEEAFEEVHSVEAIAATLRAHGVTPEVGTHGLATSLRASLGPDDGPTIAILAEYDALPEIGHACGHHLIAAAATGAFLGLAGEDLPGRVLLLGTPAEEGNSGKELLAREGFFDGVDAALMVHPFGYDVVDQPFLGRRQLVVRYRGVAAHASAQPYMGRNALDAVALNYQAVALLRQHLPPSDRVHGVIREGGTRPSIVPETAVVEYYVRSAQASTLKDLSARLEDIANGIARATGTVAELTWDPKPFTLPLRTNSPLAARWAGHQAARGRTVLAGGVVPEELAASTDFGNVSVRIPSIHPMIAVSDPDVALHTREFATAAGSPAGDAAALDGADSLALTVLDWLHDADLRAAVRADFEAAGGELDVPGYFD